MLLFARLDKKTNTSVTLMHYSFLNLQVKSDKWTLFLLLGKIPISASYLKKSAQISI